MIDGPLGLYQPGKSLLHRAPVSGKLLALAALSIAVLLLRGWRWAVITALVAVGSAIIAGLDIRRMWRAHRMLVLMVVLLIAYQGWHRGWGFGLEVGLDLLSLIWLASVLTATTPTDQLLDALVFLLRPLRRFGVSLETVSLTISLMLTAVPTLTRVLRQAREAGAARGLRSPWRIFVPAVLRTVAHAQATADALVARGLVD